MPIREKYPQGTPSWIELGAPDQSKAERFYGALFGWKANRMPMGDGAEYSMMELKGKTAAAIYPQREEQRGHGVFWTVYFTVDDADASAKKIGPAGGTLITEPFDVFDAGRMFVAQDSEGAMVCFWQPKAHIGSEIVNEAGALIWTELYADDRVRAARFYAEVLGIEQPLDDKMDYQMLAIDGRSVAGIMNKTPEMEQVPSSWQVYFEVDDADAAIAQVKQLGGDSVTDVMEVPGVGRFAVVKDDQGAMFSVMKSASVS